jgi:hypothetical protein
LFCLAIAVVVAGFVGYYSRVSLISEFQQQGGNLDYLFMQIHQVDQDEADLKVMRGQLAELEKNTNGTLITIRGQAFASPEYKAYLDTGSAVTLVLYGALQFLADDYPEDINKVDYSKPDLNQARVFADPRFKASTLPEQRTKIYALLSAPVQDFRKAIVAFNAQFGNQINQIENIANATGGQIRSGIREILVRNPQWASTRDIEYYSLGDRTIDDAKQQEFARQRAVIKSYENALPWVSWLLHAPTIVATLLVTLATGWLGGVIGHMGATVRSPRPSVADTTETVDAPFVGLIRRSILGITAALGIFLFAGSGLLVLSSQSAKYSGLGIELSPYFVAFLAFISGFLADEAFTRLTKAGRLFFQPGGSGGRPAAGNRARGQRTPPRTQV